MAAPTTRSRILRQQLEGTIEARERAAAFDVHEQQDVGVGEASGLDVRQIPVVEVDLGDAPRPSATITSLSAASRRKAASAASRASSQ